MPYVVRIRSLIAQNPIVSEVACLWYDQGVKYEAPTIRDGANRFDRLEKIIQVNLHVRKGKTTEKQQAMTSC